MGVLDDFYESYEQPKVGDVIVGFSGIDPLPKGLGLTSSQGTIQDVGSGASEDEDQDVPIDHEGLDGLLGGSEFGHYHFTEEEHDSLIEMLENMAASEDQEPMFNLTEEEYNRLMQIFDAVYADADADPVFIDEDKLRDLIDERIQEYMSNSDSNGDNP